MRVGLRNRKFYYYGLMNWLSGDTTCINKMVKITLFIIIDNEV